MVPGVTGEDGLGQQQPVVMACIRVDQGHVTTLHHPMEEGSAKDLLSVTRTSQSDRVVS